MPIITCKEKIDDSIKWIEEGGGRVYVCVREKEGEIKINGRSISLVSVIIQLRVSRQLDAEAATGLCLPDFQDGQRTETRVRSCRLGRRD